MGLGTVLQCDERRVQIFFPASGEMRLYAAEQAPLRRVHFRTGDIITSHDNKRYRVKEVQTSNNIITYLGDDWELSETLLSDQIVFHTAEDRLLNRQFDPSASYRLRSRTLDHDYERRQSRVRGFLGGRIDLIPHQLYIAHEVTARQAPRVLLSDEVGLGKTIEACLIIHRLLLSGVASRVLIVVPAPLVYQWFLELYRRFNLWFNIYDEDRSAAVETSASEANPFYDDQLVLCSLQFLLHSKQRSRQVQDAQWDLLVVDEAHHLEWSPKLSSPGYTLVEQISQQSDGLLLLTATPEQLGEEGHFARLRLLDPDRYTEFDAYREEESSYSTIADICNGILESRPISEIDTSSLETIFPKQWQEIATRLEDLSGLSPAEKDRLVYELLDIYGPGRVIFRNTRAAIPDFPNRKAHLIELDVIKFNEKWADRHREEFLVDASSRASSLKHQFLNDPRIDWLVSWIKKRDGEKALLICRSKEKVIAIEEALRKRIKLKASVFHEELSLVQRDRNAAWFAEEDGAQLLICSEIGSEGRNFQFTHNLILFDLPHNPELLEQRIGRLDRIGQKNDIHLFIPFIPGTPQEVLSLWYHKGINGFEESIIGGPALLKVFGQDVFDLAIRYEKDSEDSVEELNALIKTSSTKRAALGRLLEQGRNRLLELHSFHPETAASLIRDITNSDQNRGLEQYMLEVFDQFGIVWDELTPRTYRVIPGPTTSDAFPGLPEDGTSITFNRNQALVREDIAFLTWDHPMVTGAIDLILGSEYGNSTFAILPEGEFDIWMDIRFVLESIAPSRLHVDRFLAPSPMRVLIDSHLDNLSESHPENVLESKLVLGGANRWLDSPLFGAALLSRMIACATEIAQSNALPLISTSMKRMSDQFDHEIDRLMLLRRANKNIRMEEIDRLIDHKRQLSQSIQNARLRISSIRLIGIGNDP